MAKNILTIRNANDVERYRDAKRVSIRRAIGREIEIPSVRNPRRRRKCRQSPTTFLRTYFEEIFYNPFSKTQRKMISAFMTCIEIIGWKAIAAERGGGKTQISIGLAIYAMVYGLRKFVVLLGKNATEAATNSEDIKEKFEDPDRFQAFSADFPEICTPVQELAGAPQRANMQSYQGKLLRMKWSGERLVFPAVPGSKSAGTNLLSRGLDSAIRGTQKGGMRPDLVLIDDPETEESAKSKIQTDDLDKRIRRSVAGLTGPNRAMAILYLGTIAHADCCADRYTDPSNPDYAAWSGERFPLLEQYPDEWEPEGREGFWQKYIVQYQRDEAAGDKLFTKAHAMYKSHRKVMDKGAITSSDYHFKNDADQRRTDGTSIELSTLQACMNHIAKVGLESFNTEYQQIPPTYEKPLTTSITRADIMNAITGRTQGVLPPDTVSVDAGIDAGATACHWVVIATAGAASHIIDYGVERVHSPLEMNLVDHDADAAVEEAILMALLEIRGILSAGWAVEDTGEILHLNTCLVDSGYKDTAVYEFVRSGPRGLYLASKGFGTKAGQKRYTHPAKMGHGRKIGDHWFATRQTKAKLWLYSLDSDFWKERIQNGFMLPHEGEIRPGSTVLFGTDPARHSRFGDHIAAEVRTTVFRDGKEMTYWDVKRARNHWLDATYQAAAAAGVSGQPIMNPAAKVIARETAPGEPPPSRTSKKKPLQKMSDMQTAKRSANA